MITVIDKIKKPAAKWVPPPPKPIFRTTLEHERYLEVKKTRWREGYGDGYANISGMHYFYLTEGTLKDGSDGTLIKPKYRDADEWIISPLHDAFWNLKNHMGLVKRREIGATSIGAGLLPAYAMRMFPNSTFGLTSCDKDRIFKAFSDKTEVFIKELDIDIRPVMDRTVGYKENATKNQVYQRLPFLVKDVNGEPTYNYADLFAKETSDSDESAKGFSSTRMRGAYYDEFPLHRRKAKLLNSSIPCFTKGTEQSGLLFWAGTVEEGLTPEQIFELEQLVTDSKLLNFKVLFAPAWWGLKLDENGVSDEKAGVEWVMSERERLDKLEDKSFLKAFIKNYPLTLEEIFDISGSSRWNEEAISQIKGQAKVLALTEQKPKPYSITVRSDGIKAEGDKKSNLFILEHPLENVKYMMGIDTIITSEMTSVNKNASQYAAYIQKGVHPQSNLEFGPVAKYAERPRTIEAANHKALDMLKYYNQFGHAKVNGELNGAGEHFLQLVKNEGMSECIVMEKDNTKKGNKRKSSMWFYRSDKIIDWQYEAANIYFKRYSERVYFLDLLKDCLKPENENTDELDAFLACLHGWGSGDILADTPKKRKTMSIWITKYETRNGMRVPVLEEVQVNDAN